MIRILYLLPGPAPPPRKNPQENMFYHLSEYFCGDLLATLWGDKKNPHIKKTIEEVNFQYHVTFSSNLPNFIKIFWDLFFYLYKGVYFHYFKKKYQVVITYGPFKTGLAGYLIKKLTGVKLIVEIPGNPRKSFLFYSKKNDPIGNLKTRLSDILALFIINRADHIKLLYPDQLSSYEKIRKSEVSIFHDFVPINFIRPSEQSDKYILFIGHPWLLKGVDILIKAFQLISNQFPDYKLKIVGHCPDMTYFQKLAEGNKKIELCKPVVHSEAMKLMSKCSLFILPSRTEGMGRVLLEALASKKPVVASNVDGIPHYIKHGYNGLLFESENVQDLAAKIKIILSQPVYAARLAENGYKYVHEYLSEGRYVECFRDMIERELK